MNSDWPLTSVQVAFNAGPNTMTTPTWTDISDRVQDFSGTGGKQYELDQLQGGEFQMTVLNQDEYLNPANGSSPYWPNVLPYRRLLVQAIWPPEPVGAAVNLLNANGRQPGTQAVYDPTFESYGVGDVPAWAVNAGVFGGINPQVTTAQAWQGTKSLGWSVTAGANRLIQFTVRTIPGQPYCASVYVYQTAAHTLVFYGPGTVGSTTSTNAWTRLSCTFTASQPVTTLVCGSTSIFTPASVYIDGLQLEVGSTASAFSADGPVIYGVFGGYVERWPTAWDHAGRRGWVTLTCVDPIAVLAQQVLNSEVTNAILSYSPDYYWPLWDQSDAKSFGEASGNGGPPLSRMVSKDGPSTDIAPGTGSGITGDPGGVAVRFTQDLSGAPVGTFPGTALGAGTAANGTTGIGATPANPAAAWALTVACWVMVTTSPGLSAPFVVLYGSQGSSSAIPLEVYVDFGLQVHAAVGYTVGGSTSGSGISDPGALATGQWYHIAATVAQDPSGNTVLTLYRDGVQVATTTVTTASLGGPIPVGATNVAAGGLLDSSRVMKNLLTGDIAHIAVWDRALSAGEIYTMSFAGTVGWDSEHSGDRISRWLGYAYKGPTSIRQGLSQLGVSQATRGSVCLDLVLLAQTDENGVLFADGDGYVQYYGRDNRYLNTSPQWTLGEGYAPYKGDVQFDFDPTLVYNDVTASRIGGISIELTDQTSIQNYGNRGLSRQLNIASDSETIDAGHYLINRYSEPAVRVNTLTLEAANNPANWPTVLGIQINNRARVVRTTSAFTMDEQYFIEQLSPNISFTDGTWSIGIQGSPVDQQQAWILGDTTFGVLGSTTVLGY